MERWIGTVRRECLDRLLIFNRHPVERTLGAYVLHYNGQRPDARSSFAHPTRSGHPVTAPLRRSSGAETSSAGYEAVAA